MVKVPLKEFGGNMVKTLGKTKRDAHETFNNQRYQNTYFTITTYKNDNSLNVNY